MIISFSDSEEHIMQNIMGALGDAPAVEHPLEQSCILTFSGLNIHLKEQNVILDGCSGDKYIKTVINSGYKLYTFAGFPFNYHSVYFDCDGRGRRVLHHVDQLKDCFSSKALSGQLQSG